LEYRYPDLKYIKKTLLCCYSLKILEGFFLERMSQWPTVWLLYGVFGLIDLCLATSACENLSNDPSGFVGSWWVLSSLILGISISAIQMSIVGKTLAFMLPGHERGVRPILLGAGLAVIGIFSLVYLSYPGISPVAHIGLVVSAFSLGMFFYWLGVGVVLVWGMKYVAILLIIGVFIFSMGRWFEWIILELPILSIMLGAVATGVFWWLLRQPEFFKQYCRETWYSSAAIAASKRRQPTFEDQSPLPARRGRLEIITERFFLKRMQSCKSSGTARYLWGQLYEMLGPSVGRWKSKMWALMPFTVIVLVCGYMIIEDEPSTLLLPYLLFPFIMLGYFEQENVGQLVVGGRRERYVSVMTITIVLTLTMTLILLVACLISIPLQWVLPNIDTGGGFPHPFHAIPMWPCWAPFWMVPLNNALLLIFRGLQVLARIMTLCICGLIPIWLLGNIRNPTDTALVMCALSLIIASWVFLGLSSWYVCHKWSLVRTRGTW
jgi:hypothetical protein